MMLVGIAVVVGLGVETCCWARYSVAADLASDGIFDRISGVLVLLLRSGDAGAGLIVDRSLVVAIHGSVASVGTSAYYYVKMGP